MLFRPMTCKEKTLCKFKLNYDKLFDTHFEDGQEQHD